MKHMIRLGLDQLPLVSVIGSAQAERPFVHADRTLPQHVLLYVQQGEIGIVEDGMPYVVQAGELLFLKAGVHHWGETMIVPGTAWFYAHFTLLPSLHTHEVYDQYTVSLHQQYLEATDYQYDLPLPKHARLPPHNLAEQRMRQLVTLYLSSDPFRIAHLNAVLYELLADIYQLAHEERKAEKGDILTRKLITFLEQHHTCALSSAEISTHMCRNYKYLCSLFKQKTGFSINEYHTRLRINEASRLLRETPLNVSEAGYSVGYHDPLYFSNVFKKVQGKSPSQYLKQISKGID